MQRTRTLYLISLYALIPFIGILLGFFFVGIKRKFGDFYLKRSIGYLIAAAILRIFICMVIIILY